MDTLLWYQISSMGILENAERPIPEWLKSHTTEKGFEEAKPIFAALKEKGMFGHLNPVSFFLHSAKSSSVRFLYLEFEQVLSANFGVGHFVKIFPGVSHGWSVRYSHDDAAAVKSAEEALADMIDWFNKNLK
ncbi:hypothetical protein PR202_gb01080 [Eleusine coracana subsp. coracana]|uniref:Dienelactone hydrolase domain-containing protein n=1 Tax=Eleusine coracana subsp. coracana TaxID=191504 RepID=A0AAV5DTG9_ELECO|nr:hypothetical protein PR202_gb01080 [Eleusine coracana subsp. coracana]